MSFTGGNLSQEFSNSIVLGAGGGVINTGANGMVMSFSVRSGYFNGRVRSPEDGVFSFSGVAVQKGDVARGYFLGTSRSGKVEVGP